MKWLELLAAILCLTPCAANDRSLFAPTSALIEFTPLSRPTRSIERTPTRAVVILPTIPAVATNPVKTETPDQRVPTPMPMVQAPYTATFAMQACPSWPEPVSIKMQAAVQHFEHGLMFWLQDKNEIWVPKSGTYELTDEHGNGCQLNGAGGVAGRPVQYEAPCGGTHAQRSHVGRL